MSDPELTAMGDIKEALDDLDASARLRVLQWVIKKFEISITEPGLGDQVREERDDKGSREKETERFDASLASHIRSKCTDGSQVKRFLVAADWLRRRGLPLSSTSVAKALAENHQARLANPADCLNKNVAKGFCEKTKDGFFVTPEGLAELGYP